MPLNNKVISDFVKATNNTKKEKKEKIVYGHIVIEDGKYKVKLDGSTTVTPVSRFTSSIDTGQRVIVMIKNHEAIVTGNADSPATTQTYVDEKFGELSFADPLEVYALWDKYFNNTTS